MVEKMTEKLVLQMQKNNLISPLESEQYKYVLLALSESFITIVTILFLGMFLGQVIPTICFLFFFLSLRKRTGGYHLGKFWQCYFGTAILYVAVVGFVKLFSEKTIILYIILFCSAVLIEVIGTVNHPNMDMDYLELRGAKKAARLTVLLELMVILIFELLKVDRIYINYMSMAIILCAILLLLAKLLKQERRVP